MSKSGQVPTTTGSANADPAEALMGGAGFGQFAAQAELAGAENERLAANAKQRVARLRANAQLQKDEWKSLDETLVDVAQENLVVVDRLRQAGLTLNEDLSTLIHEFQTTNEFGDADVDMAAETGASEDASTFNTHGVPLPIVHKSFHIPYRTLLASRSRGASLDTQNQSKAARKVSEGLEGLTINGWNGRVEGYQAHGLRTHPDRNTLTGSTWNNYTTNTADAVRDDVLDAVETLEDNNYGPGTSGFVGFFGRGAYQALRRWDTGTDQERGLLERLREEFDYLEFNRADAVPDGEAVIMKPTSDVMELAIASDLQNVEWNSNDGFTTHMKVMASMTPVVKSDEGGQSGIVHMTGLTA